MKKRKKRLSRLTVFGAIVLTAVLCATVSYKNYNLKAEAKEYSRQLEQLQQQKEELDTEAKDLEEFQEYVKTDDYVEDVAREKFGLVYKDEIVFEPESGR